jgi:aspartokinase
MEGISVAEASRRIISNMPSVIDGIKLDIINFSSLAEQIKDKVEKLAGRKVGINAIKMALMRYAEDLKRTRQLLQEKIKDIIAGSILELKNDLILVTVRQHVIDGKIDKIFSSILKSRFLQITQGTNTFNLIMDEKSYHTLKSVIGDKGVVGIKKNQSAIILVSPPEIIEVPGVVDHLLDSFSNNNVNITQIISCHTDTVFLVDRKDALIAYDLLESKIISMRS